MNVQYLKYALDVAETGSITKTANNFFISQSNLSTAIKRLEQETGITLFRRTQAGTKVTSEGLRFLNLARPVVYQMNYLENEFIHPHNSALQLNISFYRFSTFCSYAIINIINLLPRKQKALIHLNEGGAIEVIEDVYSGEYEFGIVKYMTTFSSYYEDLFELKNLKQEILFESQVKLLISENHPLANKEKIVPDDLIPYVDVGIGENESQLIPYSLQREKGGVHESRKTIYTYDRATLMQVLSECNGSYTWISKVHPAYLKQYKLILREVAYPAIVKERAVIIHLSDRSLIPISRKIINQLKELIANAD